MNESYKHITRNEASVIFLVCNPRREHPWTAHVKSLIDSYKTHQNKESKFKSESSQLEKRWNKILLKTSTLKIWILSVKYLSQFLLNWMSWHSRDFKKLLRAFMNTVQCFFVEFAPVNHLYLIIFSKILSSCKFVYFFVVTCASQPKIGSCHPN